MRIRHLFIFATVLIFALTSCKKEGSTIETKKETKEIEVANIESVSLNITGMTCEIGCAKTIQSKLSKKEGVAKAKVVFKDSIATIEFDANKTSSEDLISFIDGIAGGDLYKASKTTSKK